MTGARRSPWRARVGIVNPSRGDVLMYEYYRAAPPDVIVVPAALNLKRLDTADLERVYESYEAAVRDLAYEECDIVVLGGSPPVTAKGYGVERELVARAQRQIVAPVVALVRCEVEALEAVGAKRIAIGAPYTPALTEKFAAYFRAAGFDVLATRCLGIDRPVEMAQLPQDASADVARALRRDAAGCDAIHLTCPRWPTLAGLAGLERELGLPVTSSSQSVVYGTLRRLGIADARPGFGSLLEGLAREPATA
jgi:maleate cis-trans isomerase